MIFLSLLALASSEIVGIRTIISTDLAEGQLFRVRYNLTNKFTHPVFNVTLLDPSFTRQDFLFIEGKSKARLTFGTVKPDTWVHVDLDMEPRKVFSLALKKAQLTYDLPEEISEKIEMFSEGEIIEFKSSRSYYLKYINFYTLLVGFIVLGVLPVAYSNQLKKKRLKIYKSN